MICNAKWYHGDDMMIWWYDVLCDDPMQCAVDTCNSFEQQIIIQF